MDSQLSMLTPVIRPTATPELQARTWDGDEQKKLEACREFEAYFIAEMFKEMRKGVPEGGLIPRSSEGKMMQEMLDQELARIISIGQPLGVGEILYREAGRMQDIVSQAQGTASAGPPPR